MGANGIGTYTAQHTIERPAAKDAFHLLIGSVPAEG